ncbi:glycine cleavage system protein R [Ferrimonas marina]|uniref:Glycine cleavage system transcriptional repressor n=1 Tax=Ferrimonas marina TaxID=299255 RepID=A0A1M5YRC1_9GAMM|nr:ACT domain-containing protein [Ferrimonas marina]SHI14616.1 Glycine cleavage system regulatory protein [Ferrimonas marina]
MNDLFVMSVEGPDRTGLLRKLAETTHAHGGKWLASKLSNLEGRFVALIKVEVPSENTSQLKELLVQNSEVTVTFYPCQPSTERRINAAFNIDANDRPGLVNDITQLLANHDINIEELDSHRLGLSDGQNLFTATLSVTMPPELDPAFIARELEGLHEQMAVNVIPTL